MLTPPIRVRGGEGSAVMRTTLVPALTNVTTSFTSAYVQEVTHIPDLTAPGEATALRPPSVTDFISSLVNTNHLATV